MSLIVETTKRKFLSRSVSKSYSEQTHLKNQMRDSRNRLFESLSTDMTLKTEMIIFQQKKGFKINWKWGVRLNGYKLKLYDQIKYLGMYLDKYLNGHYQSKLVIQKIARAIGMLSKVRHYAPKSEIKNIYHAIFESHLCLFLSRVVSKSYSEQTHLKSQMRDSRNRLFESLSTDDLDKFGFEVT